MPAAARSRAYLVQGEHQNCQVGHEVELVCKLVQIQNAKKLEKLTKRSLTSASVRYDYMGLAKGVGGRGLVGLKHKLKKLCYLSLSSLFYPVGE